ncbi:MAG: type A chloramphenicol O-acetyltransferase [Angelakisella sp.]|jgi:chloramphenicol O-acetyltransferase type A|nr:type A chloramphenicol O-acetyltransferase [Angelakisella sp.]
MTFTRIDLETWERKELYLHFINEVRCTYSATVSLDITRLKGERLYPAMLWLLTRTVNQMPEFRTALTAEGLGIYDRMHPAYTVFNRESKTFSGIWTEAGSDYGEFRRAYEADAAEYSSSLKFAPKPNRPPNSFDVSMVPWLSFTAFDINIASQGNYLLPIFTMGRFSDTGGVRTLPLAIQVHHAVCDGYHVGRFAELLQEKISSFNEAGAG